VKVVVDTNVIFSALLNTNSIIGDLIFNSDDVFQYYSCSHMRAEIEKHWDKLKKISKLSNQQLNESNFKILAKIHFVNEELIPEKIWIQSEDIARDIDIDDTDFIALTKYLKASLWTGDKVLYTA
jgi:predicted nucleic acid-binding protein